MRVSFLLSCAALCTAGASIAAPPIAYVVSSKNASEVWLMNPDGSGRVKVYTGPRDTTISDVDVRSGGGQLALIEWTTPKRIKLISYDAAGAPTEVHTVPQSTSCNAQGLDYHPTNQSIIYTEHCTGSVRNIATWDGQAVSPILANVSASPTIIRWLRDGSGFIWKAGSTEVKQQVRRSDLSNPSAFTVLLQLEFSPSIAWFDTARTDDAMLLTFAGPPAEVRRYAFDFAGATDQGVVATGQQGHYSPDDSAILYRFQTKSDYEARIKDQSGVRTIFKGRINALDWGN